MKHVVTGLRDVPRNVGQGIRDRLLRRWLRTSPAWIRRLSGGRITIEDQVLDAHVQGLLFAMRLARIREPQDVRRARRAMDEDMRAVAPRPAPMRETRDLQVPIAGARLGARWYVPPTAATTPPLLVYFHGGGFVVGSLRSHDAAVRELAHGAGVAVLAVEYRLAPEHKAPTAALDAHDAYLWARAHAAGLGADPERVGVGGDSAGGNVAAVLCHVCRARSERQPDVQVLVYPATDLTCGMASHQRFRTGFLLEGVRIEWYLDNYVERGSRRDTPMLSPLFWDRFDGLAPAIVVTAGYDPLRDEGKAYAERLSGAGVAVSYRCERGLVHGFFNLSGVVPAAREANQFIASEVRRILVA